MQVVTAEFKEAIEKQIHRKIYSKIQINYTDPYLDQSINIETSDNAYTSYPYQVADGIETPKEKWFSLDGSCELDGTYKLAPAPDEAKVNQMGWWGDTMSKVDGIFDSTPTITALFFERPVKNLKVVGDDKRGEYPIDFTIKLLSNDDTELFVEQVIGNDNIKWTKDIVQVNGVSKMKLEINKWSAADRQAKIIEFFTSIQETYEDNEVISIELLEERDVSTGSLPIGNISSNEIIIQLSNEDKRFDVGNIDSNLHGLIRPNRKVKAWLGTGIITYQTWEYIEDMKWEEVIESGN